MIWGYHYFWKHPFVGFRRFALWHVSEPAAYGWTAAVGGGDPTGSQAQMWRRRTWHPPLGAFCAARACQATLPCETNCLPMFSNPQIFKMGKYHKYHKNGGKFLSWLVGFAHPSGILAHLDWSRGWFVVSYNFHLSKVYFSFERLPSLSFGEPGSQGGCSYLIVFGGGKPKYWT